MHMKFSNGQKELMETCAVPKWNFHKILIKKMVKYMKLFHLLQNRHPIKLFLKSKNYYNFIVNPS